MSASKKPKLSHHDSKILEKLLENLTCGSPGFPHDERPVVTISPTAKIDEAVKKLIEQRVLSLPVVDGNGKAIGIVSILDLVVHVLKHFDKANLKQMEKHTFNFYNLVIEKKALQEETVSSIEAIGFTDKIFALKRTSSLKEAIKLMMEYNAHRILVLGDQGQLINIITQSRIMRLLTLVIDNLQVCAVPIADLGIAVKQVVSVREDEMACDAFQKMKQNHISAVAVVNARGQLIGNISASDVKLLGYSMDWFDSLAYSAKQYLVLLKEAQEKLPIRSQAFQLNSPASAVGFVVKCSPNTALGMVIKLVLFYEVHRVYVTDSEDNLLGIITLGDIIRTIFNSC